MQSIRRKFKALEWTAGFFAVVVLSRGIMTIRELKAFDREFFVMMSSYYVGEQQVESRIKFERNHTRNTDDQLLMTPDRRSQAENGQLADVLVGDNMTKYLKRGPNFIMTDTGCKVSSFVWNTVPRKFADCKGRSEAQILEGHIHDIQENDTVYIPIQGLDHFAMKKLPDISASFVLISGSFHYPPNKGTKLLLPRETITRLIKAPNILKWFCHNPEMYVGKRVATRHSNKIVPFPFGLQHMAYTPSDPDPKKLFLDAFMRHLQLPHKTNGIFVSYVSPKTNKKRKGMQQGEKLPRDQYYDEIARSRFILSPAGDRPECYRHYEAIAFGTVPITELDPALYPHFENVPIIYNNSNWKNLTEAEATAALFENNKTLRYRRNGTSPRQAGSFPSVTAGDTTPAPVSVQRNMIFEEYWLEYVEQVVGRPLRWWDRRGKKKVLLEDFQSYHRHSSVTPRHYR